MPRPRVHACLVAVLSAASLAMAGPAPSVPADSSGESPAPPSPVLADSPAPTSPVTSTGPLPRLAVVRPALVGFTNPALADSLAGQLDLGMQRGQARVLARDAVDRVTTTPCEDSCLRSLRAGLGADYVLRTTITGVDRDYVVRLELVDGATRAAIVQREATCELCSADELQRFVVIKTAGIVAAVTPAEQAPPRMRLDSQPGGARIYLDGRLIGMTPFAGEIPGGEHVVRLDLAGHISESRRLSASPGVHALMDVALRRVPTGPPPRRGGFAMLFPGVAAALAGLTLIGIDDRPRPSRCAGVPADDCGARYNTDIGGATLLAAGALLITAGVLTLVRPRHDRKPRVRAGLGGAGFVLRGAF